MEPKRAMERASGPEQYRSSRHFGDGNLVVRRFAIRGPTMTARNHKARSVEFDEVANGPHGRKHKIGSRQRKEVKRVFLAMENLFARLARSRAPPSRVAGSARSLPRDDDRTAKCWSGARLAHVIQASTP